MLAADRGLEAGGVYKSETIAACVPSTAELDLAVRALDAVPGGPDRLAYGRVDVVPDVNEFPLIIELELTEPSLFMSTAAGSSERFADAIVAKANAS